MEDKHRVIENSHAIWTRRKFLKVAGAAAVAGAVTAAGAVAEGIIPGYFTGNRELRASAFIASVSGYNQDIRGIILSGFRELGIHAEGIKGKKILLKPNLVNPQKHLEHLYTHPLVIRGAVEAFLSMGADEVFVAEASGHGRDSFMDLEESGLADILYEDKIPFVDLNESSVVRAKNLGQTSQLEYFYFPEEVYKADIIVSMAKMKTHHWAGVTLSMKNMFGVMPGIVYGWPKNLLHWAGIDECIYDINATLKPSLAIVDGIVGMEGDGPIMGDPVRSNVIIMGLNSTAVDATCARIMGIDPDKIPYLKYASGNIGPISETNIEQRGETVPGVQKYFRLIESIPAQKRLRL
ncbi:MAG: DUF362 domain-containing protein [Pseudomonadota bacterium]|nr:DUF362 domain-containing protein [Pseudomonadota bacterium]MBU1569736.1 DUF362 domain-containing protein [Pseudomonadota bacterium]